MSEQPSKVQGRMQVSAVKVANAARALVEYLQEVADEQGRSTELASRILETFGPAADMMQQACVDLGFAQPTGAVQHGQTDAPEDDEGGD